jgi:RHS repeat-associated protein
MPYAFGSGVKERNASFAIKYRSGFNDKEINGDISNDNYDFGARIYDARLGRWTAVDPLQNKYAYLTPFAYTANNPICLKEIDGKDFIYSLDENEKGKTITVKMTVFAVSLTAYYQALAGANLWNQTKFQSKGYTVKFDIQVQKPPVISQDDVIKYNSDHGEEEILNKRGKPNKKYRDIEEKLINIQMMKDATTAYNSGEIGKNNVYAGSNSFDKLVTKSIEEPPKEGETRDLGVSNGRAIVTHKVALPEYDLAKPQSSNEPIYRDQGEKPYVVGHELGHNLGLPDYTTAGLTSGGIMDYLTAEGGKPSQIEVDDLVTQIINHNKENKDKASNDAKPGSYGNAQFKREKSVNTK